MAADLSAASGVRVGLVYDSGERTWDVEYIDGPTRPEMQGLVTTVRRRHPAFRRGARFRMLRGSTEVAECAALLALLENDPGYGARLSRRWDAHEDTSYPEHIDGPNRRRGVALAHLGPSGAQTTRQFDMHAQAGFDALAAWLDEEYRLLTSNVIPLRRRD